MLRRRLKGARRAVLYCFVCLILFRTYDLGVTVWFPSKVTGVGSRKQDDLTNTTHHQDPKALGARSSETNELSSGKEATAPAPELLQNSTLASLSSSSPEHADESSMMRPSILHYTACCGLGHRLVRMANENYVAKARFNFGLTADWGQCNDTDVYTHLFEPEDLSNTSRSNKLIHITDHVPGFALVPARPREECLCKQDEIDYNFHFYASLLERFRFRQQVTAFTEKQLYSEKTVIGIHIRAGNGETGDFERKKRQIGNEESFRNNVVERLKELIDTHEDVFHVKPPLIFIATDTQSMIDNFREALNETMPVVDMPQHRPDEGAGVLFGELGKDKGEGEFCLRGWEETVTDMMLLAMSDIVVATRCSSFVHSMPINLVLRRSEFPTPFCEISKSGKLSCFESFMRWCCEAVGKKAAKMQSGHFWEMGDTIFRVGTRSQKN